MLVLSPDQGGGFRLTISISAQILNLFWWRFSGLDSGYALGISCMDYVYSRFLGTVVIGRTFMHTGASVVLVMHHELGVTLFQRFGNRISMGLCSVL
jgi:hypothetical protein